MPLLCDILNFWIIYKEAILKWDYKTKSEVSEAFKNTLFLSNTGKKKEKVPINNVNKNFNILQINKLSFSFQQNKLMLLINAKVPT